MIRYITSHQEITKEMLAGFFVGWPNPPSLETHLRLLQGSTHIVLAVEDSKDRVVGFITAISDGVLSAYIPLLEVLPEYQGHGIGSELSERLLADLAHLYMVDVVCDREMVPFYARFGMKSGAAMMLRNYEHQCGTISA